MRHHKGCDNYIGKFHPYYREHYWEFNDCVRLCHNCHDAIHKIYLRYIKQTPYRLTKVQAFLLRRKLIRVCDKWIARNDRALRSA